MFVNSRGKLLNLQAIRSSVHPARMRCRFRNGKQNQEGFPMASTLRVTRLALGLMVALLACVRTDAADEGARLAALKSRIKAMAAETTYVEAITKIQRLGRAFGYYTDKGFFGEAADLFPDRRHIPVGRGWRVPRQGAYPGTADVATAAAY